MVITRALASCGWLCLAFFGFCAGVAAGTTFVLAAGGEDEVHSLLTGYGAGILAFALPAAMLEWYFWFSPARGERGWRRPALSK
jgi:hypothetical protein